MLRFLLALVFAVASIEATALATRVMCTEECEDDTPEGQCAPDCTDCGCCQVRPVVVRMGTAGSDVPLPVPRRHLACSQRLPDSIAPREIQHIPKLAA